MKDLKNNLLIIIVFCGFTLLIFWQFFLKGLYPYPGNFMIAWFEPWKTINFVNGNILIPHKPVADDVFRQVYPFKTLAMDMLKKFEFPLWNPYNGAGMPLFATINTGFLDPFNILYIFLPYYLAWSIYIVIQPVIIGYFTYLYCKSLNLSIKASLFTSVIFIFSGLVTVRLVYGMYGLAISMLPLLLFLLESYLKNQNTKLIYLLPLCIFIVFVSTQPQITLYIFLFITIYFLFRIFSSRPTTKIFIKKTILPLLLFLIGIGLSSVQLFPTFELLKYSNMNTQSSSFIFDRFLLPIQHFVTVLIPNYFGNAATYNYWGYGDYVQTNIYLGIIPCFFAFLGLINISKNYSKLIKFFSIIIVLTIIACINWVGSKFLYSLPIPLISTGIPSRIFLITTFCIAMLAGFGFDSIYSKHFNKNSRLKLIIKTVPFFLLFVVFILALTYFLKPHELPCMQGVIKNCRGIALRNTLLELGPFIIFLVISVVYILWNKRSILIASFVTAFLIVSGLGLYNNYKFLPFSPKETFYAQSDLIKAIQEKTGNARVFGMGGANIPTNFATYYHFYDPQYYHPLYIKRYGELVSYAYFGKGEQSLARSDVEIINNTTVSASLEHRRNRLFALTGIKYLIYKKSEIPPSNNSIVWQNNEWSIEKINTLEKAGFYSDFEVVKNKDDILKKLFDKNFDPHKKIILEEDIDFKSTNNFDNQKNNLVTEKYNENNMRLKTNLRTDKILMVLDNYYPGWKAYIDGIETKIYRADYTFRAIVVPKGQHEITIEFKSDSFKIGLFLSLFSLGVYLLIIIFSERIKKKYY